MGDDNKTDYAPGARYCSKQAAGELFGTNFLHSLGALTGCGEIIDTHITTDHYHALEKKKRELESAIESARWNAIQTIMEAQTSQETQDKGQEDIDEDKRFPTFLGVDESTITALKDLVFEVKIQDKFTKTTIDNRLKLLNFAAVTNILFLYIIAFVLLVFVKWN